MNEDKILVEALKNSDHEAFNSLFRKYAEKLYVFALSITKDKFVAEEIVQIVFLKIWNKRQHISEHFSFKSFLFSVTYNETISWIRKENSEKRKISAFYSLTDKTTNETEILIEFHNLENLANHLIETLPERRKKIFKLSREQGYSNKEIAEKLNISVKTVENQMTSALRTLRESLEKTTILGSIFYFLFLV